MSMRLFLILTILFFQRGLIISSSFSDIENQNSLCHQYHRIKTPQRVSYVETYIKYTWQVNIVTTRINFRTENVTKWSSVEMCCNGYEPDQLSDDAHKCVPICSSGCTNGECSLPNVCICNLGYKSWINNWSKSSECVPECESGCEGGICVKPNVCDCLYGYIPNKDNSSCAPSCISIGAGGPEECGDNASCISPNTCQCNDGYAPLRDVPVDILSDNQTTTPTTTTDQSTIIYTNPINCRPVCKSDCRKTSVCVGPNICECISGYQTRFNSSHQSIDDSSCVPICDKTCFNGYCGSPNQCVCHEGYKPHRWLNASLCEPFCQDNCINGKCTLPNQCECFDGYEKLLVRNGSYDNISENVCIPICPGKCANGNCIAPGQCHCNLGYTLVFSKQDAFNDTVSTPSGEHSINFFLQSCEPLCEPSCPNGSLCIAPNQCQSQFPHGQDFSQFPTNHTRIVNSTKDCSTKGLFFEDNGNCFCNYDSNGQKCSEPSICAILMTNGTETREKFITLERIVLLNGTIKTIHSTGDEFDWSDLKKCRNECRILISSKEIVKSISANAKNCYRLKLYNATVGLLTTKLKDPPSVYVKDNSSLLCFVSPRFGCTAKELHLVSAQSGAVIGSIVGTIFTVALIIGVGLTIYLTRRKKCSIRLFRGATTNSTIMEQSEATDSPFNTEESSHL